MAANLTHYLELEQLKHTVRIKMSSNILLETHKCLLNDAFQFKIKANSLNFYNNLFYDLTRKYDNWAFTAL